MYTRNQVINCFEDQFWSDPNTKKENHQNCLLFSPSLISLGHKIDIDTVAARMVFPSHPGNLIENLKDEKGGKLRNMKWIHFVAGFKWTETFWKRVKTRREITWWGRTTIIYWSSVWSKFGPLFWLSILFHELSIELVSKSICNRLSSLLNPRHFNILSICASFSGIFIAFNIHEGMKRDEKVTSRLVYGHAVRSVMILSTAVLVVHVSRSEIWDATLSTAISLKWNVSANLQSFQVLDSVSSTSQAQKWPLLHLLLCLTLNVTSYEFILITWDILHTLFSSFYGSARDKIIRSRWKLSHP